LLAPSESFRVFGGFTRDGRHIFYSTTQRTGVEFDIHRVEVETGEDVEVLSGRRGLYVGRSLPTVPMLLSESRGEDANDVLLFDVATGDVDTLFAPDDRAGYVAFAWQPDAGGFYMATDQDREHYGLARYDIENRVLDWVATPETDVEDVGLSYDGRYLIWTTNEGGYSALHARDLRSDETIPTPQLPPGIYSVTWAEGANVAAISMVSPRCGASGRGPDGMTSRAANPARWTDLS
jgi:hypothetical protein